MRSPLGDRTEPDEPAAPTSSDAPARAGGALVTHPSPEELADFQKHPFWTWMGLTIESAAAGKAVVSLAMQPHHRGGGGTSALNGGVIAYMCDAAAGAAAAQHRWPPHQVTVSLDIVYLAPVLGPVVRAEAVIINAGRTLVICDIAVRSGDGRTGATARAILRLFTRPLSEPGERPLS